ncbi:MAG: thiamine phosphate synthase [Planctomycetota bacterium]|nr:thiamine phosphate synthase [Planctomycetota bacterium]
MNHAARIIDANANRAREALRVLEDAARFLLGSRALSETLKTIRHELATTLARMPGGEGVGLAHRDTPRDVGTDISVATEYRRAGVRDVVLAAGKRLTEALRSIEEYAKALPELSSARGDSLSPEDFARAVEQMRYRAYSVERRLLLALGTGRGGQWRLCLLVTESLCAAAGHGWLDVAIAAVQNGADCVQLRERGLADRELASRAARLVETVKPLGASVVVNDRADIAVATGADGVHLGQTDLPVHQARKITGFELLVGVSTGNLREAEHALRDGADYCGVGPMFASTTKSKNVIAGPMYLMEYLRHDPPMPPHLAIGGITPENVVEVVAAGARGVAVSGAICGAGNPGAAARAIREVVDRYSAVSGGEEKV